MEEMRDDFVYLSPETRIEPLCCRWWAWSHLISPPQHAMNIAFRQLPLLRSFVKDPATHVFASQDPSMVGAPIVHLELSELSAAQALIERMIATCTPLIQFSEDFITFNRKLQESADGFSLDSYYAELPKPIAGMTEIAYDLDNHPTLRILEEFSDVAGLENKATQELMFFQAPDESRDFFLSTPRLERDGRVFAHVPFDSPIVDEVARSRTRPVRLAQLAAELTIPTAQLTRFGSFFQSQPPNRRDPVYRGDQVRLRYFGHACVMLQTAETSILLDPCVAWQRDDKEARLTFADLPDFIEFVFITHGHHDHFCPEVLLQLRNRIGTILVPPNNPSLIADPSIKLTLKRLGFHNVVVMNPLDTVNVPDGFITSVPFFGEHCDLNVFSKHAMFVQIRDRRLLFLADSSCINLQLYRQLAPMIGNLDALFIGMECHGAPLTWLYEPYLSKPVPHAYSESRRLSGADCERAWSVIEEFKSRRVFVYAMGQEPWLKHIMGLQYDPTSIQLVESDRFVRRCREAGIESQRLYGCQEMLL